jgi:hypothetical protein
MGFKKPTKKKKTKKPSLERAFLRVFQSVKRKIDFTSAPVAQLKDRMLDALIQAATSKCVEFNLFSNRSDKRAAPAFTLLSSLRGICEDLIVLNFISRLEEEKATKLIGLLIQQNLSKGLSAQQDFFKANNPTQPVLQGGKTSAAANRAVSKVRDELRAFWAYAGSAKRDGPTIRDMATEVGLSSTYEYIYFANSNFVHFNPQALLRTGWGPQEGPFAFSIHNMGEYYRRFSSFYGAVLFIGFYASFGENHLKADMDDELTRLLELISHVHRWPEVVTFEEMNQEPPPYLLTHALGKVMREEDPKYPYGAILHEVQALRQSGMTCYSPEYLRRGSAAIEARLTQCPSVQRTEALEHRGGKKGPSGERK